MHRTFKTAAQRIKGFGINFNMLAILQVKSY